MKKWVTILLAVALAFGMCIPSGMAFAKTFAPEPIYVSGHLYKPLLSELVKSSAKWLLVDDDKNYDNEQSYLEVFDALDLNYDYVEVPSQQPLPEDVDLSQYDVVVWFTGADFSYSFLSEDRARIETYLQNGGRMVIFSKEALYDTYSDDPDFWKTYFGVSYVADSAGTHEVAGVAGTFLEGMSFGFNAYWPDVAQVEGEGQVVLTYVGGSHDGEPAGVMVDNGTWKTMWFGFGGLEYITDDSTRVEFMAKIVDEMEGGSGSGGGFSYNLLLVDDDGGHDYQAAYEQTLDAMGIPYDVLELSSTESITDYVPTLDEFNYDVVIWVTGQEWHNPNDESDGWALTASDRDFIEAYLNQGGKVLLFGPEVGYEAYKNDYENSWLKPVLGADNVGGTYNGSGWVDGMYGQFTGDSVHIAYYPVEGSREYVGKLAPYGDGVEIVKYGEGETDYFPTGKSAAIGKLFSSGGRSGFFAFDLGYVDEDQRVTLLGDALDFSLGVPKIVVNQPQTGQTYALNLPVALNVYKTDADPYPDYYQVDILSGEDVVYTATFAAEADNVSTELDVSSVPTGTYDISISAIVGGLTITQIIPSVNISSTIEVTYNLSAGWNLISFPGISDQILSQLFPAASAIYRLDGNVWYVAGDETPAIGVGYMVKVREDTSVTVELMPPAIHGNLDIPVSEGWNAIGSVHGGIAVADLVALDEDMNVVEDGIKAIFSYQDGVFTIVRPDGYLEEGKGYLVKVKPEVKYIRFVLVHE